VMNAVERYFLQAGYLHFVVCHQGQTDLMDEYPKLLMHRFVDGLLLVNTDLTKSVSVPVISISGHIKMAGLTNIVLDHDRAALLALQHLYELGHRTIAFMKGQSHIPDSQSRWESTMRVAAALGLTVDPNLCLFLTANSWSPELGYKPVKALLERTRAFTAIFCFNDTAALGAIRAIADAGLSCPQDISIVGFDDISHSAYHLPSITTIRQPLRQMGEMAAQMLIKRIQNPVESHPDFVTFLPELIVRESTAAVKPVVQRRKTKSRQNSNAAK
jgi:DNA-binding LacI/PurR family transcriptional regulator